MVSSSSSSSRRSWSSSEKAQAVRRHLRDGIPVSNVAESLGAAPSQVHAWIKQVLEQAEQALSDRRGRPANEQRAERELAAKEERIRHLQEVTAELSMEVLQLKKARGAT